MLQVQEEKKFWEEADRQDSLENERLEKKNKDILVAFTGFLIFTQGIIVITYFSLPSTDIIDYSKVKETILH